MFAAGKRFMQQRCASHGGAVLHSISVHADRAIGKHCYLIMAFFCTKKCGCNSTKNSAFFERERGRGGKGKLFFP